MASALPPGPEHDKYTEWARQQGVGIHNVTPARFPGRGLGLVATADIKVTMLCPNRVCSCLNGI